MVKATETPGPADYTIQPGTEATRNKNPTWVIGTGNRGELAEGDKNIPGVGTYDLKMAPKGPYYSVTGKGSMTSDVKDNGVPGSNAYLPNLKDLRQAPAYSFTHAQTGEQIDPSKLSPGPGQYNLEKDNDKPKYSFGREDRSQSTIDEVPGPGQYPYKSSVGEGAKITIGEKLPFDPTAKEQKYMPGPGQYNVRSGPDGPLYSIGTSQRQDMVKKTDGPGPADYGPDDLNKHRNKNPEWKIGTGQRKELSDADKDIPGAGKYYKPEQPKGPYYSITSKGKMTSDIKDNGVPASNSYLPNLKDLRKAPAYTFTKDKLDKDDDPTKENPGPGSYNLEKENDKPKYGFGSSVRDPIGPNDGTPGPGQYPYKSSVGEGAKITIGEKLPYDPTTKELEQIPGPGNYKLKDGPNGPLYSIGTSQRQELAKKTDGPGPAGYTLDKGTKATKNKNPEWKIGTGERKDLASGDKDVPGAGEYYKPEQPKGPHYSITGKGKMTSDVKNNGVPASNTYDIEKATAGKKKNPSWKIGTSKRDDEVKKKVKENVPGPGTYEQEDKTKIKHPEFKFGTGKREGCRTAKEGGFSHRKEPHGSGHGKKDCKVWKRYGTE